MVKKMGIRISIPFLEEFLFENKIHISNIKLDYSTDTIVIYLHGAGNEIPEACVLTEIKEDNLPRAIMHIKECLNQD